MRVSWNWPWPVLAISRRGQGASGAPGFSHHQISSDRQSPPLMMSSRPFPVRSTNDPPHSICATAAIRWTGHGRASPRFSIHTITPLRPATTISSRPSPSISPTAENVFMAPGGTSLTTSATAVLVKRREDMAGASVDLDPARRAAPRRL
jgi:hypothetical protein